MLEEAGRLLLDELADHVAQDGSHGIKALVCRANVVETVVVQEYLLNDEDCHRLAQLGSRLHDSKTEGYYLRSKEKIDDLGRIILDKGPDDA